MNNKLRENSDGFDEGVNGRFLNDTLNLFSGYETGHMNPYAFNEPDSEIMNDLVHGGKDWERFIAHSKDYYVINEEIDIIHSFAKQVAASLPDNAVYVDLGPGEEKAVKGKTLPFLSELAKSSKFIAVDVNAAFAKSAAQIVEKETGLKSEAVQGDFLAEQLNLSPNRPAILSLFGGLLSNGGKISGVDSQVQLTQTFNRLAQNIKPGDYLVITQDYNQDEFSLLAAYTNPDWANYVLSTLHRVKRDLPTTGFDPSKFDFVSHWLPEENLVTLNAKVKPDETGLPLFFKIAGVPFALTQGKEIPLVNCYKYPVKDFMDAAISAGFVSKAVYKKDNNRIALHVLKLES